MRCRWLGWAGVEVEQDGDRLVIDPLGDPGALYAVLGDAAARVTLPEVVDPAPGAVAGLVSHLHRDHADAPALKRALVEGAPVLLPEPGGGPTTEEAGLLQATRELEQEGLTLRHLRTWETVEIGPFTVTALPAADGTGDPQLSWAVEAGGQRIVHCGDTLFHGWWWRAALRAGPFDAAFLPINGAVLDFPWRQPPSPLPGAMTPEEAAVAAQALSAQRAVPMHFGAFDLEPYYRSIPDALDRFLTAAGDQAYRLEVGEELALV
jgi:L-ascorbate metabolism protein UlaG (beta-lactamase superfamily)